MTNFFSKIATWFQPKTVKKSRTAPKINRTQPVEKLIADLKRQLIGKLAKIAIATQRERQRRRNE